ncbi:hypothetical protein F5Y06DRAFT_308194 [Hypoxylon sp. FL0890]|nr:hypothetical protein F5Y06DRAFT_308194 [Hypoxylon sp. FL0890]
MTTLSSAPTRDILVETNFGIRVNLSYEFLEDNLTYEEILLSSFPGISGLSYFINDGRRGNRGIPQAPGTLEPRGIIIGLVGPRFERLEHMDAHFILNDRTQRQMHPDLKACFEKFFYWPEPSSGIFNSNAHRTHIRISADILLLDANERAKEAGRKAHYIEAFCESLTEVEPFLGNIATLEFAYITVPEETRDRIAEIGAKQGITVKFSKREPAAELQGDEANQLLVVSYARDGNSFPGNEYWEGSLDASDDSAAACMSTIAELHNPLINPNFLKQVHDLPWFEGLWDD